MSTSTTPADAPQQPIQGYYGVRKGKGGLQQCIFVSWDRAKEYCDGDPKEVEFSFFSKVEDAVEYIYPTAATKKKATEEDAAYQEEGGDADDKEDTDKKSDSPDGPNKRKGEDLDKDKPVKKSRSEGDSKDAKDKAADEGSKKKKDGGEGEESQSKKQADTNEANESQPETEKGESEKGEGAKCKPEEADNGDETESEKEEDDKPSAPSSHVAPLNILLEQGFQQNLPKGWRSQHLDLYLNRRDYFKEPALKQYLIDLNDLNHFREKSPQPAARSEEKHISGASSPLSVYYLNWAWGVCNSYHRDIQRQQKKITAQPNGQLEGVELPHFKAHASKNPDKGGSKKPSQRRPSESGSRTGSPTSEGAKAKPIQEILEESYTNSRPRGWRALEILPKQEKEPDDEEEAEIHKTYITQLKRKHFTKELKKLQSFRDTNPTQLERYSKPAKAADCKHASGIASPFDVEYLKFVWDIQEEDIQAFEKLPTEPRPNRRTLPTREAHSFKPGEVTSSSGPQPEADAVGSSSTVGMTFDITDDDETPQLIEALRSSWFRNRDKGWRSIEMGLQVDPRSKTLTMSARKKREQLYIHDLEVLKQWWKTYPSSQHYIFTVPEEGKPEEEYKNMSYAAATPKASGGSKSDQKRHKSGINAPWSLTYLNWSWGVSNSYNRDLVRKEKRKAQYQKQVAQAKEDQQQQTSEPMYI